MPERNLCLVGLGNPAAQCNPANLLAFCFASTGGVFCANAAGISAAGNCRSYMTDAGRVARLRGVMCSS